MTGREAADEEVAQERRKVMTQRREEERTRQWEEIAEAERANMHTSKSGDVEAVSDFSQRNFGDDNGGSLEESLARDYQELFGSDNEAQIPEGDSEDEIQYMGTQPRHSHSQLPLEEGPQPASPLVSEPSPHNFSHIDDFPALPTSPQQIPPPPLTWPARRNQQRELVEHPSQLDPAPTARSTRARKGVEPRKTKRLESQAKRDKADADRKLKAKEKRVANQKARNEKKEARLMEPRKEDVSQLADKLLSSSL